MQCQPYDLGAIVKPHYWKRKQDNVDHTNKGVGKVKTNIFLAFLFIVSLAMANPSHSGLGFKGFSLFKKSPQILQPVNRQLAIPVSKVNDGKAHHFKVKADDGTMVTFFVLKSKDGIIRAAIDACDVCFQSGKGYVQEGDKMVCINCGQKFDSNKINVIKGGCNPAPLKRKVVGDKLIISMNDINTNSWYCEFKS